ncbi:MAG: CoA transferase subunit A [Candidatus Marinimicrobia bacterium]|nr:CoA transferase subunit A [Candidatus Neomarinimicrobiota bacterium]
MESKLLSMKEAVERYVLNSSSVAMSTFMEQMIVYAAAHEIIRQRRKNLTLIGPISDLLFDQLIGAGCVSEVKAAWVGNVMMGSAYQFRRAVEEGVPNRIKMTDYSNLTMALALHAAALGVPFLPTRSTLGSDILDGNPYLKEFESPVSEDKLVAVEALVPDVAILPVQRCDEMGNAHVWGSLGISIDAAKASKIVILIAEEIVSAEIINSDPGRTLIQGFQVNAVVHEPWACHPSPVQGYYNRDDDYFAEYHSETKSRDGYEKWLDKWVYGVDDREHYLSLLGDERIDNLKIKTPAPSVPVDYGI